MVRQQGGPKLFCRCTMGEAWSQQFTQSSQRQQVTSSCLRFAVTILPFEVTNTIHEKEATIDCVKVLPVFVIPVSLFKRR